VVRDLQRFVDGRIDDLPDPEERQGKKTSIRILRFGRTIGYWSSAAEQLQARENARNQKAAAKAGSGFPNGRSGGV
jgi:hypothetical protein